jgi:D-glycero-D-manno-heptose 1,7-bisphosphate phosphatase
MPVKTDKDKNGSPLGKSNISRRGKSAVFLDRDGTIIEDRGHLRNISDVVFFQETFEALQKLHDHFMLFIVTNQVGVAEGIITTGEVARINSYVVSVFAEKGIAITDVYVCPHRRTDNCPCIKPKPYFMKKAAKHHGIDLGASFVVGDHPHDILLAQNTGAHGIYVLSGHGHKHLAEISDGTEVVTGIKQAAEKILSIYRAEMIRNHHKQEKAKFILNLGVACELWLRTDLGPEPRHASEVAKVLCEAGIRVYDVSGGWLECEPRPVGIYEALSGRLAPSNWIVQFNYPSEQQGHVLKLLAEKGIPVCDSEMLPLENQL